MKGFMYAMLFATTLTAQQPQVFTIPPNTPQIGVEYDQPHWHRYKIHGAIKQEELGTIAAYINSRPIIGVPGGLFVGPEQKIYSFDRDGDYKIESRLFIENGRAAGLEVDLTSPCGKDIVDTLGERLEEIRPKKTPKSTTPPTTI
jgi:hypothetical protein